MRRSTLPIRPVARGAGRLLGVVNVRTTAEPSCDARRARCRRPLRRPRRPLPRDEREQLGLDEDFSAAGIGALLGMGSAPGKTNLLTAAAAQRLGEEPRSLEIWAAARDPPRRSIPSRRRTRCGRCWTSCTCGRSSSRAARSRGGALSARRSASCRLRSGARRGSTRSTRAPHAARSVSVARDRVVPALPGTGAAREAARARGRRGAQPYEQSEEAVAVHLVELLGETRRVVGGR